MLMVLAKQLNYVISCWWGYMKRHGSIWPFSLWSFRDPAQWICCQSDSLHCHCCHKANVGAFLIGIFRFGFRKALPPTQTPPSPFWHASVKWHKPHPSLSRESTQSYERLMPFLILIFFSSHSSTRSFINWRDTFKLETHLRFVFLHNGWPFHAVASCISFWTCIFMHTRSQWPFPQNPSSSHS